MRTKEKIVEHLTYTGYKDSAIDRICGFLIGIKIKDSQERFLFKRGQHDFEDFLNWVNCEGETIDDEFKTSELKLLVKSLKEESLSKSKELGIENIEQITSYLDKYLIHCNDVIGLIIESKGCLAIIKDRLKNE